MWRFSAIHICDAVVFSYRSRARATFRGSKPFRRRSSALSNPAAVKPSRNQEEAAIVIVHENGFAPVAARHDMLISAGELNTQAAGHEERSVRAGKCIKIF